MQLIARPCTGSRLFLPVLRPARRVFRSDLKGKPSEYTALEIPPPEPRRPRGLSGLPCSAVGWEKGHVTGQTDHAAPSPDRWHTRTQIRKTASNGSLTALHGERRTHLDRALVAYTTTPQRSTRPVLEQRQQRRRLRNSELGRQRALRPQPNGALRRPQARPWGSDLCQRCSSFMA